LERRSIEAIVTRSLALSLLLVSALVTLDATAQGIFSPAARRGEPLVGRRVPMVRDLQDLASGRAMDPWAVRRVARHGPVFPTREQLLDRLARDRNDGRRAVFASELLRIGDRSFESTFVGAFARAGKDSAGILARGLAFYASSDAVDALVRGLGRAPTASAAEEALASMGGRAVAPLLEAARGGARAPGVFRALGRLGDERARESLLARANEADPALSRAVSLGLVLLDPAKERARAEALIGMLEGEERALLLRTWLEHDPEVARIHLVNEDLEDRRLALSLATTSAPALDAVRPRLLEVDASRALGFVALAGSPGGRRWLLEQPVQPALLPAYALAAARADAPEERAAFLARLEPGREAEGASLLRALLETSRTPDTPALFRALEQADTFSVAAYLLAEPMKGAARTARDRVFASLRAGLRSADPRARIGACTALGVFGDRDAWSALLRALEDADPIVRVAAAQALMSIAASPAKKELRVAIRTELEPAVREALAAIAAGRPGESELGRAILGVRPTEIPNAVILFASGAAIAY
jgi:hypothetical protein